MAAPLPVVRPDSPHDVLWERCRNSLGIARLLVHEGRPAALVATACELAVENACRAALAHAGRAWDGDLGSAFSLLSAPAELREPQVFRSAAQRLAAAEQAVGFVARQLRQVAPERTWGF